MARRSPSTPDIPCRFHGLAIFWWTATLRRRRRRSEERSAYVYKPIYTEYIRALTFENSQVAAKNGWDMSQSIRVPQEPLKS